MHSGRLHADLNATFRKDSMKVSVAWNVDLTPNWFAGKLSKEALQSLVWKEKDGIHSCCESNESWKQIFRFEVPDIMTGIRVSGEAIDVLRPFCTERISARRRFEGEDFFELNQILSDADSRNLMQPVINRAAEELKATRSWLMPQRIARKVKDIRLVLEKAAEF
jgi:hypothetical protein